jgi:antitoxin MazE
MNTVVKTRIVKMGNSRGIRIPKLLLDQLGLNEEVELAVQQNQLVIRPVRRPRHDWDEQLKLMAERGDDRLLDTEAVCLTQWDTDEWEWT